MADHQNPIPPRNPNPVTDANVGNRAATPQQFDTYAHYQNYKNIYDAQKAANDKKSS